MSSRSPGHGVREMGVDKESVGCARWWCLVCTRLLFYPTMWLLSCILVKSMVVVLCGHSVCLTPPLMMSSAYDCELWCSMIMMYELFQMRIGHVRLHVPGTGWSRMDSAAGIAAMVGDMK